MLKVGDGAMCVPDVTRYIINLLSNLLLDVFRGVKGNLSVHIDSRQPIVYHDDSVDVIRGDVALTA